MRLKRHTYSALAFAAALIAAAGPGASLSSADTQPEVRELATFAATGCSGGCGSGSTVGPDGALYVTDGKGGRVLRVDPNSGALGTFATGLPRPAIGIGGAIDVAFLDDTAYVLVTLVGPFFGQPGVVDGLYRINDNGNAAAVADIGTWSTLHPPLTDFFVTSGLQYALQPFRDGFLVTDGHHNRMLQVTRDGQVVEQMNFDNTVPTGLDVRGETIYMGEAGAVPHLPKTGKIVSFTTKTSEATEVASGAPLIVDAEWGAGQLYALSQGVWDLPDDPANAGAPASPNTGTLVRVEADGRLTPVVAGLDRPTSLEFIGRTAFVTTLSGRVLRIDRAAVPRQH